MRSAVDIFIGVTEDTKITLETVKVNKALKDHAALKEVKEVRGDAVTLSTYDNQNQLVCSNYDPIGESCIARDKPSGKEEESGTYYAKTLDDTDGPVYHIADQDKVNYLSCYNEDKLTL